MKNYKIEEKLFLSKAIISNVHSMRLKSRFTENNNNEELVDESIELAVLMLKKRNELFGESPKKESVKKEVLSIDFDEVIETFNQVCFDLPQVTKATSDRKKLILNIFQTHNMQDVKVVFKNVMESDYLSGRKPGTTWKATFDWILTPNNFIKIFEGNYKNINNGTTKSNTEIAITAYNSEAAKNFRFK